MFFTLPLRHVFLCILVLFFIAAPSSTVHAVRCARPRCIKQHLFDDSFNIVRDNGNSASELNQPTIHRDEDGTVVLAVGCNNGAAYYGYVLDGGYGKYKLQPPQFFHRTGWQNAEAAPVFARQQGTSGDKLFITSFYDDKAIYAFRRGQTTRTDYVWRQITDSVGSQNPWGFGSGVLLSSNRYAFTGFDAGNPNANGLRQLRIADGVGLKSVGSFQSKSRMLLASGDTVYVVSTTGTLYSLDLSDEANPTELWNTPLNAAVIYQSPVFVDEAKTKICVCTEAPQCVLVDASNGNVIWTKPAHQAFMPASDPSLPGLVFVATTTTVSALSVTDGSEVWQSAALPHSMTATVNIIASSRGMVYVCPSRWILAINGSNGGIEWIFSYVDSELGQEYSIYMILDEPSQRIYATTTAGTLFRLKLDSNYTETTSRSVTAATETSTRPATRTASETIFYSWTRFSVTPPPTRTRTGTRSRTPSRTFTPPPTKTPPPTRTGSSTRLRSASANETTATSSRTATRSAAASLSATLSRPTPSTSHSRATLSPSSSPNASLSRSPPTPSLSLLASATSSPSRSSSRTIQPPCGDRMRLLLVDQDARRRTAQLITLSGAFWLTVRIRLRPENGFGANSPNSSDYAASLEAPDETQRFSSFVQRGAVQVESLGAGRFEMQQLQYRRRDTIKILVRVASSLTDMDDVKLRATVNSAGFDCAVSEERYGRANLTTQPLMWSRRFPFVSAGVATTIRRTAGVGSLMAMLMRRASTSALGGVLVLQRSNAIQAAGTCEESSTDGELSVVVSPTQLQLGGSYSRGALVGNFLLFIFFVLTASLWVAVKSSNKSARRKRRGKIMLGDYDEQNNNNNNSMTMLFGCIPFDSKEQASINFPSLLWPPAVVLGTGSITAGTNLIFAAGVSNIDIALCALSLIFVSFVTWRLLRPFFPFALFKKWTVTRLNVDPNGNEKPPRHAPMLRRCLFAWNTHVASNYVWSIRKEIVTKPQDDGSSSSRNQQKVETTPEQFRPRRDFLRQQCVIFDNTHRWIFFASMLECVLAALSSLSAGLFHFGPTACGAARYIIGTTVAFTLVLALQAPYVSGWESIFSSVSAAMMVASTLSLFAAIYLQVGDPTAEAAVNFQLAAELVDLILNALCMAKFCVDIFFIILVFVMNTSLQQFLAPRAKRARREGQFDVATLEVSRSESFLTSFASHDDVSGCA